MQVFLVRGYDGMHTGRPVDAGMLTGFKLVQCALVMLTPELPGTKPVQLKSKSEEKGFQWLNSSANVISVHSNWFGWL